MVKTFNKNIIFLIVLTVIFSGCSNLKYLKPGEVLYTGADVKINPESKEKIKIYILHIYYTYTHPLFLFLQAKKAPDFSEAFF